MLSEMIRNKAEELGYTACGIIPAVTFDEYLKGVDERSELFPQSKKHYDKYRDFAYLPKGGKSIIVCTQRYNSYSIPAGMDLLYGKMYLFDGRISYSAENRRNTEFETFMKINELNVFECAVPDRWAAARAGLGTFGRNNFIYDPNHGSYISLEAWVVDKELEYDTAPENCYAPVCNDNCHKCIDACPTKALTGKLTMDMGRCICRVQFDDEDALDEELREKMGVWIYGCDACQDVCPMNKGKFNEASPFPMLKEFLDFLTPEAVLAMDEYTYRNILNPRFWYAGEDGLWLWKCNTIRSMVNSGDSKYHDLIRQNCVNSDERIGKIAKWGCKKLGI